MEDCFRASFYGGCGLIPNLKLFLSMAQKEHPFIGIWYAAIQEIRTAGKWRHEYEFAPGEWLIGFTPDSRFLESFQPDNKRTVGRWEFDESGGIIAIVRDGMELAPRKCVFEGGSDQYLVLLRGHPAHSARRGGDRRTSRPYAPETGKGRRTVTANGRRSTQRPDTCNIAGTRRGIE